MSDRAVQLLDLARQAGAEAAEVYQTSDFSRPVFFEANRLKQLETNASDGIALRLWKDGRPGLAVAFGPVEPAAIIQRALALADLNPSEAIDLTPARQDRPAPAGPEEVPVETLVELGKAAIARIREAYPNVICEGELQWERQTTRLVNSQGLDCCYESASLSAYLGLEWVRGDDFLGISDGEASLDTLDCDRLVEELIQRVAWASTNAPAPTGQIPVLFTDKAADSIWSVAVAALNGKRVVEGTSPWSDRRGATVSVPELTLRQQPHLGPSSCPFDDEGVPTQAFDLIRAGKVAAFFGDRTIGRQLGTGTTGNGFRPSLGRYPTPSLVNLTIDPGKQTLSGLIAGLDRAIVVDQTLGSGPDLSGEFSLNIDLGYAVERGEIRGRLKDTMIAGNAYGALKNILALGSDRRWHGSCLTPCILVGGLSAVS